ncbi:radical SAM protein [Paenibacillus alkalitolerans]|uniref:radical SAM protein n=1 Tax=Paenibacillus alkalitolerans TaxID=2799335 RepID=UPI0018F2A365|nr:radical SAM protein [Paenibacillus alkalitolerans]
MENYKQRIEQLEPVIVDLLNMKLESIPEKFHDLIPAGYTPEEKLMWLEKAHRGGLFHSWPLLTDEVLEDMMFHPVMSDDNEMDPVQLRAEKLSLIMEGIIESKLNELPEELRDIFPPQFSAEDKVMWLAKAEKKGLIRSSGNAAMWAQRGKLGTGPNTGPGTAPGTGPGTEIMSYNPTAKKQKMEFEEEEEF